MKISVLINNYNYERFLDECLSSVFTQTRQADEVIVVDDGSTDGSTEKLAAYQQKIRLITQENQGQAAAMATATQHATGDILCYLDSDDLWQPDHLQSILDAFKSTQAPEMAYTNLELIGNESGLYGPARNRFNDDTLISLSQQLAFCRVFVGAPTSSVAIRAKYAKSLFRQEFTRELCQTCGKANGDEILVFGSSLLGCRKLALSKPTARYRIHETNHYYGKDQTDPIKQLEADRQKSLIRLIARQQNIKPDLRKLEQEMHSNIARLPLEHHYVRGYLKGPRKFGLKGLKRFYWKSRLKRIYRKAH